MCSRRYQCPLACAPCGGIFPLPLCVTGGTDRWPLCAPDSALDNLEGLAAPPACPGYSTRSMLSLGKTSVPLDHFGRHDPAHDLKQVRRAVTATRRSRQRGAVTIVRNVSRRAILGSVTRRSHDDARRSAAAHGRHEGTARRGAPSIGSYRRGGKRSPSASNLKTARLCGTRRGA
jgi:hypothetical protein